MTNEYSQYNAHDAIDDLDAHTYVRTGTVEMIEITNGRITLTHAHIALCQATQHEQELMERLQRCAYSERAGGEGTACKFRREKTVKKVMTQDIEQNGTTPEQREQWAREYIEEIDELTRLRRENNRLSDLLAKKQRRIEELEEYHKELMRVRRQAEKEKASLHGTLEALEKANETIQRDRSFLQNANDDLNKRYIEAENQAGSIRMYVEATRIERDDALDKLENIQQAHDDLAEAHDMMIERVQARLTSIETAVHLIINHYQLAPWASGALNLVRCMLQELRVSFSDTDTRYRPTEKANA